MSHNLSVVDGIVEMFATSREPVWHGLGQRTEGAVSADAAIKMAHLDWDVALEEVLYRDCTTPLVKDHRVFPNASVVMRADNGVGLGIVGKRYRPVQNRDAFAFLDGLVDAGMKYESAGALGRGEQVWVLAKLPDTYTVGKDDKHEPYVLFVNSHDGSKAVQVLPTLVRVVCQNTLNTALGNMELERTLRVQHTGDVKEKIRQAQQVLGIVKKANTNFVAVAEVLRSHPVTTAGEMRWFESLMPMPEKLPAGASKAEVALYGDRVVSVTATRHAVRQASMSPSNVAPADLGTWWALWNGLTYVVDHARKLKAPNDTVRAERRLADAVWGDGAALKTKARIMAYGEAIST
jgi:phage/plasmid-like protein (TIGR03299 family)